MTIEEAQRRVDEWIKEYGVRYFNEMTNMAILTEEVGEVARIMARKYGEQSFKAGEEKELADELADVLRGLCMGLADSVPGVSGGTIAFLLGFYEKFVVSVNDFLVVGSRVAKSLSSARMPASVR